MDEVTPSAGSQRALNKGRSYLRMAIALLLFSGPALNRQQASGAEGRQASEYEVKAAFLLNFTKFVEWPKKDAPADAPFVVCILGDDPFGAILDQTLQGEQVKGRKLVVERVSRFQQSCAVLFVSKSEKNIAQVLLETLPGVLTIGETDDFLKRGGMINFTLENRRVRFDVNQRAAAHASLQISSRLLNVARTVEK